MGRLEARLRELGLYAGSVDNVYGSEVQTAVRAFQTANGLTADGVAGPRTWAALFPGGGLSGAPLAQRCLALTGAFETSAGVPDCFAGISGDFDGQGLSFGVLQWNIGQGTLQPMLAQFTARHGDLAASVFADRLDALRRMLDAPRAEQLAWARSTQDTRRRVTEPWAGMFRALGRTPEFQQIQTEHAAGVHQAALELCARFGVTTERAVALMFDIRVQNYSISAGTEAKIREDFAALPTGADPLETEAARLRSIANRRAEAAGAAFAGDVRARKLTIANGAGTVHGVEYDLERQFGIGLREAATGYKL